MFEYAALVDAPVKRFTSIVTDSESEEAPVVLAVVTAAPPIAVPLVEAPVMIVAAEPEPIEASPAPKPAEPVHVERPAPLERPVLAERPLAATRPFVPRADPAPRPSMVPTLIGIAAAGITAFWWMRRDSHGRGR